MAKIPLFAFCIVLALLGGASSTPTPDPVTTPQPCNIDDPEDFVESECPAREGECLLPPRTCKYMKKGLGGGGSKTHCENTIESAERGLKDGATVLEVDVCQSSDGVLFLWFDCDLRNALAIARRLGHFLHCPKCVPHMDSSVEAQHAGELTFAEIRQKLGYKLDWCSNNRLEDVQIPTLEEFLRQFASNEAVVKFEMDIKVRSSVVKSVTRRIWRLAHCLGISSKIVFSFSKARDVALGQCALTEVGGNPQEVSLDFDLALEDFGKAGTIRHAMTAIEGSLHATLAQAENGVCPKRARSHILLTYSKVYSKGLADVAKKMNNPETNPLLTLDPAAICCRLCIRYCSIGVPPMPKGFHMVKQTTLRRSLATRAETCPNLHLSVFGASDMKQFAYLMSKGVDTIAHCSIRKVARLEDALKIAGCKWKCDSASPTTATTDPSE